MHDKFIQGRHHQKSSSVKLISVSEKCDQREDYSSAVRRIALHSERLWENEFFSGSNERGCVFIVIEKLSFRRA